MKKNMKSIGCFSTTLGTISVLLVLITCGSFACTEFSEENQADLNTPAVTVIFNHTGTRQGNEKDVNAAQFLIDRIDATRSTLRGALYGFSNRGVIDAIVRAYYRGVDVKVVGDARHFGYNERGYKILQENYVPMILGNEHHIMHNKFFVMDNYFTFVGTGNITTTGFTRNNNNWVLLESPQIASDFMAEWDQMWQGRFGAAKHNLKNGNTYQVGNTKVEVLFSPQEDAMGRILEELDAVDTNIYFSIFAFTKDQIGSRFVRKHREFEAYNKANGFNDLQVVSISGQGEQPKKVVGVLDRSQVAGNFLYHEVYRLASAGVPMRLDSNENSRVPGDYQAGGGRLHSKTMILDAGTDHARVITGSFNWSSAATIANDEVLLILHGREVAEEYLREFKNFWRTSRPLSEGVCKYLIGITDSQVDQDHRDHLPAEQQVQKPLCSADIEPGDVVISEVHWFGYNGERDTADHTSSRNFGRNYVDNDEFIELYNPTDKVINLSLWTITNGYDFKVGFIPGTVIHPGQYFLVLDHNLAAYSDVTPQDSTEAFSNPDFEMNVSNDPRFPRLNINNVTMNLHLLDADGRQIDIAGNSSPPFTGGVTLDAGNKITKVRSMERIISNGSVKGAGNLPGSWKACALKEGGKNVNKKFKKLISATPGEANSK